MQYFDAHASEHRGILRISVKIVGDEGDVMTFVTQDAQQIKHAHRARILIRCNHAGFDNHDVAPTRAMCFEIGLQRIFAMCRQCLLPALKELFGICGLVRLDARRLVSPVAYAFDMKDFGSRLIYNAQPTRSNAECEVGVLVVSGRIVRIKATHIGK